MSNSYHIFIFESIHKVLKTEKLLLENKIELDIIPTPKEFSSDCGMSIRVKSEISDIELICNLLKNNKIEFKIYKR